MDAIRAIGIEKWYKHAPVLKGVSFEVAKGTVLALLGDSGAGKSTLLRCLNLLEKPSTGQLLIAGLDLDFSLAKYRCSRQTLLQLRTKVGMIFQQFHLWPHKTILQNLIEAPMQVLRIPKAEAVAQAEHLLDTMGISNKRDHYPMLLSGGQQQRAAIARGLMMNPEVILFDEPTSALDPKATAVTAELIQKLAEEKITIVIASHEMKFVHDVSHQMIFLSNGKVIEHGETSKVFASPTTALFQAFIESERGIIYER